MKQQSPMLRLWELGDASMARDFLSARSTSSASEEYWNGCAFITTP